MTARLAAAARSPARWGTHRGQHPCHESQQLLQRVEMGGLPGHHMLHPSLNRTPARVVLRRKWTTKARWTDNGDCSVCCCGMLWLRLGLSLAIRHVVCQEDTSTAGRSLGKPWDLFGITSGSGASRKCNHISYLPLVPIGLTLTRGSCGETNRK